MAGFPALAASQTLDQVTRAEALEPSEVPRDVVLVGDLPDTISEAQWEKAVRGATGTWNDVRCSFVVFNYTGRRDAISDVSDDVTTVAFVDGPSEPCFGTDNDVGWTLLTPCGEWPSTAVLLNTNGYGWSDEPDPYSTDTTVDVRSVLTHELGHALGIRHEDVSHPLASMAPRYLRDGGLATLAADDKLALCNLYPGDDRRECGGDSECPGRCVEQGDIAVCDELRIDAGGYCDLADLNCTGGSCVVTSPATYSGYCSPGCEGPDDCPGDMVCEESACRFAFVPPADVGCSTTRGNESWLVLLIVLIAIRRRRCRASVRMLRGACREPGRRTCRRRATRPVAW